MRCNDKLYVSNGNEGKVSFTCPDYQRVPARYSSEENGLKDEPTQAVASHMWSKSLPKQGLEEKPVEQHYQSIRGDGKGRLWIPSEAHLGPPIPLGGHARHYKPTFGKEAGQRALLLPVLTPNCVTEPVRALGIVQLTFGHFQIKEGSCWA